MQAEQELPRPDADAQAHSDALVDFIRARIDAADGWISFEEFMDHALYAPGLGYYAAGAHKLGAAGDFITAPEISPLFGRCLALQFIEVLDELQGGELLELGAGSGRLAVDILSEMEAAGRLPDRYCILEVSPDLRQRQQQLLQQELPQLVERVEWLDAPPEGFRGVIFGNEVLDALPVARFRVDGGGLQEEGVSWSAEGFSTRHRPAGEQFSQQLRQVLADIAEPLPTPYESEVSRRVPALVAALADSLAEGLLLFIDYGYGRNEYYHPQRGSGTLMCHYRHRAHPDPFTWPGLQDITAYVDFTAVAEAGVQQELELMAYTSQAQFLLGAGMERLLAGLADEPTVDRLKLSQQVQRLTLPAEMGDRFKVIGLSRGLDRIISGFSLRDLSASL